MNLHAFRHQKLRVLWPAIEFLGRSHFVFAQWLAVRLLGILLVRRAVAYMAFDDNQRGPPYFGDRRIHQ
jgi:hypothetical protein